MYISPFREEVLNIYSDLPVTIHATLKDFIVVTGLELNLCDDKITLNRSRNLLSTSWN